MNAGSSLKIVIRAVIPQTAGCLLLGLLSSSPALAQPGGTNCQAPAELEKQIASHPTAAAYDELGAYFGQGDHYACAIPAFRASLRLNPKSWQTRSYLALALLANGDPEHAVSELRISLRQHPDQPRAHLTMGAALSQLNQADAAIEEFRAAVKADPKSVTALDWLTKALISQGRYPAAIALLKNGPSDEVLQMNLVIAYSKTGRNDEAIQLLLQMIKDRP